MVITLAELNEAVKHLPDPQIAREQGKRDWRVPIMEKVPLAALYDPSLVGPDVLIATFELREFTRAGKFSWRWVPRDEVVI